MSNNSYFPAPDLTLPMYKPENLEMNRRAIEDAMRKGALRPLGHFFIEKKSIPDTYANGCPILPEGPQKDDL